MLWPLEECRPLKDERWHLHADEVWMKCKWCLFRWSIKSLTRSHLESGHQRLFIHILPISHFLLSIFTHMRGHTLPEPTHYLFSLMVSLMEKRVLFAVGGKEGPGSLFWLVLLITTGSTTSLLSWRRGSDMRTQLKDGGGSLGVISVRWLLIAMLAACFQTRQNVSFGIRA